MKRLIIGFGHKRRRGKDTACEIVAQQLESVSEDKVRIDHFAYSIKQGIGKGVFGFSEEQLYGDLKTEVDPFWGITPRDVFQRFGTEVMHTLFGADVWARTVVRRAMNEPEAHVLVGDVRFPHEVEVLQALGAILVKIDRDIPPSVDPAEDLHSSETALDGWDGWDHVILNNGSIEELRRCLAAFLIPLLADRGLQARATDVNELTYLTLA
jgi:hypothetical protein